MAGYSLVKNIVNMDKKEMIRYAKKAGKLSRKPWPFILADIIWCGLKYQTGYIEYFVFKFYELPRRLRKTYYSRGNNNKLVRYLNDPAYNKYFDSKIQFNRTFAEYVDRDWMPADGMTFESFEAFCAKNPVIIAKVDRDSCGAGVSKFRVKEYEGRMKELYETIKNGDYQLIEQNIEQHPVISALYPEAVNTIRFCMIEKDGVKHILYSVIRMGNRGACIDNFDTGGMSAQIDIDTGVICTDAVDGDNIIHELHPYTGTKIKGTKIPFFNEAKEMAVRAYGVVPQIRYIGWDVAITEKGPQLIEGNRYPGNLIYPDFTEHKRGFLPDVKAVLGDEWEKVGIKGI